MNPTSRLFAPVLVALAAFTVCLSVPGCRHQSPEDIVEQSGLPEVLRNPKHPERFYVQFDTMGTYARFEVVSSDREEASEMLHAAYRDTQMVHVLMSTYREDSDISRLNRRGAAGWVDVSSRTYEVLKLAKSINESTGGAFEPTYAPLRELWRGAQKGNRVPAQAEINERLKLVGSDGLILENAEVRFAREGMKVDLGGIAKGYGIDQATEALIGKGAKGAMVNIGGDMRLVGRRGDGKPWKIGVQCPEGADEHCPIYLSLKDVAVATSGDYARGYVVDGERYSHILDPRTGMPVPNAPSVTVIARDAATADGLATGISVMGPKKTLKMVENMTGVECLLLVRTGQDTVEKYSSGGFSNYLWREKDGETEAGDSSGRAESGDSG